MKAQHARHLQIPQYETLTMQKMYGYISNFPDVFKYYPDQSEMPKLPKEWIANVAYSVMGDQFSDWVSEQIEERYHLYVTVTRADDSGLSCEDTKRWGNP